MGSVNDTFMKFFGLFAGSALGNLADNVLLPKVGDTMVNAGEIALGGAVAYYGKGFIQDMGYGMALDGATKVTSSVFQKPAPAPVNGLKGMALNRRNASVGNAKTVMNAETTFEII